MGIYRKICSMIRNQEDTLTKVKNIYSEYSSIRKKKCLYDSIEWTNDQQREFESYWKKYYGKTIPNKWHRLYQNINGTYCERYFPEYLYSIYLEPMLNQNDYARVISDKNLLTTLFADVPGLYLPKTYIACINGVFFDDKKHVLLSNDVSSILKKLDSCVCKPTIDTGSGSGVEVYEGEEICGIDVESLKKKYYGNYIIQEKILISQDLQTIAPHCVSTFRVITFLTPDGVASAPLAMRIGTGTSRIDNIHAGGLVIAVSDDGMLYPNAYRLGYGDQNESFLRHPDSGVIFKDYKIEGVMRLLQTAKRCHEKVPQLGMISWDFTINRDNCPVLIEANTKDQSVWFSQMVSGKPIFGEYTEYYISMMKK